MTSDEDVEKLAREEMNKRWKDIGPDAYVREQLALEYKRGCCAGFRAAEKMMAERWPSEDGVEDELSRVWGAHGDNLYRNGWRNACDWIKQKLF